MSIHTLLTLLWLLLAAFFKSLLLPTLLWVQYLPAFILIGKLQDESDSKILTLKAGPVALISGILSARESLF